MSRFVKPLKGFKNIYRHLSTLSCCVTFCLLWYIKNRLRHCCLIPNILHNIFFYFPQRKESHIRVSKVEFLLVWTNLVWIWGLNYNTVLVRKSIWQRKCTWFQRCGKLPGKACTQLWLSSSCWLIWSNRQTLMSFSPAGSSVNKSNTAFVRVCVPSSMFISHTSTHSVSTLYNQTCRVRLERWCTLKLSRPVAGRYALCTDTHTDSRVLQHTPPALTLSEISVEKTFSFSSQVNTLMQKKYGFKFWHKKNIFC